MTNLNKRRCYITSVFGKKTDPRELERQGMMMMRKNQPKAAAVLFGQAIKQDPNFQYIAASSLKTDGIAFSQIMGTWKNSDAIIVLMRLSVFQIHLVFSNCCIASSFGIFYLCISLVAFWKSIVNFLCFLVSLTLQALCLHEIQHQHARALICELCGNILELARAAQACRILCLHKTL